MVPRVLCASCIHACCTMHDGKVGGSHSCRPVVSFLQPWKATNWIRARNANRRGDKHDFCGKHHHNILDNNGNQSNSDCEPGSIEHAAICHTLYHNNVTERHSINHQAKSRRRQKGNSLLLFLRYFPTIKTQLMCATGSLQHPSIGQCCLRESDARLEQMEL